MNVEMYPVGLKPLVYSDRGPSIGRPFPGWRVWSDKTGVENPLLKAGDVYHTILFQPFAPHPRTLHRVGISTHVSVGNQQT